MSLPLVSLARTLGFHMTVVDPRPELATRERFPDADELLVGDASGIVADLPLSASTSVVLTIHDQDVEVPVLRAVLASQAGYVGMLGSRKRGRGVLEPGDAAYFNPQHETRPWSRKPTAEENARTAAAAPDPPRAPR